MPEFHQEIAEDALGYGMGGLRVAFTGGREIIWKNGTEASSIEYQKTYDSTS